MRILLLAFVLAGCDPFAFDDLEDAAGVRVLEAPDGYPKRGYGRVVVGYDGEIDGEHVSRIAVTGGTDTPFSVFPVWNGEKVDVGTALFDGCTRDQCEDGAGDSVIPIPVWRAGDPFEGKLCVLIASPPSGVYFVRCETDAEADEFSGEEGIGLGTAGASLGEDNPVGVAVLGAPSQAGRGGLFRVPDGAAAAPIELPEDVVPNRADLGSAIAAGRTSDGATLLVAGAPGAQRALVLVLEKVGEDVTVSLRACLDGSPGFGGAVVVEDLDGDGAPEILVGHLPSATDRGDAVLVYAGDELPDAGADTCQDWGAEPREIACPDGVRDVDCDTSAFGATLAVGDVDADGHPELLVGAPFATVSGKTHAGAVFAFHGSEAGILDDDPDALTFSTPEANDELGASLSVVRTDLDGTPRAEPVAGAPGADSAAVFLCSGLGDDDPEIGDLCIPD